MSAPLAVIGCGYLGRFVLDALPAAPHLALTRGSARHAELRSRGACPHALDVAAAAAPARLAGLVAAAGCRAALLLLPPSALGGAAAAVVRGLGQALREAGVQRAVLASSTAVYGEHAGAEVDAATPTPGAGVRAVQLAAIEQAWLASAPAGRVARLAGLYGPGRVVGRSTVEAGEPVPGDADAWLNLVRAEDAVAALLAQLAEAVPSVVLVSDGTPVRRGDYYGHLATLLGRASPRFVGEGGGRGGGSRRCDPRASWHALGCQPRYGDYRAGLADLL